MDLPSRAPEPRRPGSPGLLRWAVGLAAAMSLCGAAPPKVTLVELRVAGENVTGERLAKRVRVAYPKGWSPERDPERRSVQLIGPQGEGEILVAAVAHPAELGELLDGLRLRHPSAAPGPPQAAKVHGIDPLRAERATRFQITGGEVGEMMMIERGGVIVLFAAVVRPDDWADISTQLQRCYPSVQVSDEPARR